MGEQREELSRPAEQEWPWKEDRRPEGEAVGKGLPYQVLGHGLGPDVEGEAAQLRRVLKFTIEGPQVHRKDVIFRKSWFKVDHDEVVLGMAAAAPAGAIRVQAALERRCSLWGIWRIPHGIRILQLQVLGSKHGKGYVQTGQG